MPYGSRSATTVERYSLEIADMLMERQAKMIVVACNTVSSVALPRLEQALPGERDRCYSTGGARRDSNEQEPAYRSDRDPGDHSKRRL